MKFCPIPKDTILYHGTDVVFDSINLPAWFCLKRAAAEKWAGWGSVSRGERRLLTYKTDIALDLIDTQEYADWDALCNLVGDDTTWGVARRCHERGYAGWYGKAEIMVCSPCVQLVSVDSVSDSIVPWGR
jgi:hypothetical protein